MLLYFPFFSVIELIVSCYQQTMHALAMLSGLVFFATRDFLCRRCVLFLCDLQYFCESNMTRNWLCKVCDVMSMFYLSVWNQTVLLWLVFVLFASNLVFVQW